MALVGKSNEEKIWNYFKSKNLNDYGCAGLIGNLFCESGLMPNNLQNTGNKKLGMTDDEYVAAVNNGSYTKEQFIRDSQGFGICQWTYWSRKQSLYEFAKSKNKSIADLEMQLDFLYKELSESFKTVLSVLKSATSVLEASNAVLLKFERPADQSVTAQNRRASYGQKYYDKYAKSIIQNNTSTGSPATMSEQKLRETVVSIAISYLGCKESDGSHRKIVDIYNTVKPLPRGYKVSYTDAWCATYVTAIGIEAGLQDIIFRECGCGKMIDLYKKANRWVEDDAYIPKKGDIIFYDWQDNGIGDNIGGSDHVGIVVSVSGTSIKIIEGNMNNAVGYRTLKINGKYIRGYGIPDYISKSKNSSDTSAKTPSLNKTVIWKGYVTADALNVRTWAGTENAKCSFGPLKKNAIVGICDSVKDSDGLVWYYVKYNNKYGFVSSKYIKKKNNVAFKNKKYKAVNL